jgi:hypothetical protein
MQCPHCGSEEHFYHETSQGDVSEIMDQGLLPMSYGQSFVGNMGEMLTPDMFDEEELENIPEEDFVQRTYYMTREPSSLKYGDVLLRFPATAVKHRGHDIDPYTTDIIPPDLIEIKTHGQWLPIRRIS